MAGVTVDLITDDEEETTKDSGTFVSGDSDLPVVFLCSQCRLPVGDSLAWAGANPKENMIYLRSVTKNIHVDKEQKIDTTDEPGCIYVLLSCSGCSLSLGRMYLCTPVHLDFKRNMYCLAVAYIESYVLGSTINAEFVDDNKKPVVLETQSEVLGELAKSQTVLNLMIARLAVVEEKLQSLQGEG
ncbi:protein Mis18-alpha [Pristis pectinata]|uniref:protein Mis18-alpha n=1 Tax=Pristis pectinata TaxID=685728 RepID=UPI00223CB994|nr:protein Mis18-alpha [Pristis pectinata]